MTASGDEAPVAQPRPRGVLVAAVLWMYAGYYAAVHTRAAAVAADAPTWQIGLVLVLALASGFLGAGLWRLQPWAHTATILFCGVLLLVTVREAVEHGRDALPAAVLPALLYLACAGYLLLPSVRAVFRRRTRAPVGLDFLVGLLRMGGVVVAVWVVFAVLELVIF